MGVLREFSVHNDLFLCLEMMTTEFGNTISKFELLNCSLIYYNADIFKFWGAYSRICTLMAPFTWCFFENDTKRNWYHWSLSFFETFSTAFYESFIIKLLENLGNHELVLGSFYNKDYLHFWPWVSIEKYSFFIIISHVILGKFTQFSFKKLYGC